MSGPAGPEPRSGASGAAGPAGPFSAGSTPATEGAPGIDDRAARNGATAPDEAPGAIRAPEETGRRRRRRSRSPGGSVLELIGIVVVAVLLAFLIQAFIVKPYRIPSGSMEPTLQVGQRVLVDRIGTDFSSPHVGEVAVFHPPKGAEQQVCGARHPPGSVCDVPDSEESSVNFIKRIVAGPGDTIAIRNGHVILNGKREKDPYIRPCGASSECNYPTPVKIPPGHWFMMGDNRGESDDSRFWGPVPTGWIIGDAFATYWPPSRIGSL